MQSRSNCDEILAALTRADELLERGLELPAVCRELGVPVEIYHVWRRAHSRTFLATARKLEALEQVHARMLDVLTEQQVEIRQLHSLLERRGEVPPVRRVG